MNIDTELQDYEAAGSLAEELPYWGWLEDERTCLTRAGELMSLARISPSVLDGQTPQQLDRVIERWQRMLSGLDARTRFYFYLLRSVVAWIGAEMEFALSQAVASGDTFEHRPSECGHCVQDFLADLDLRDLPGEAAGSESGADDALPPADLRFYPAALVVPCGRLPGHAAVAADLGNMAIPNGWIPRRLRSDHCVLRRRYIITSRVSPYRSLSRSRVDAPS